MTWTPEETAARLNERKRYRADHPEFDDWFLRACARQDRREANQEAWRQTRQEARRTWQTDMPAAEWAKCLRYKKRTATSGGRPMRRARIETLRQAIIAEGCPEPDEGFLWATVFMFEREDREAYKARRDIKRELCREGF